MEINPLPGDGDAIPLELSVDDRAALLKLMQKDPTLAAALADGDPKALGVALTAALTPKELPALLVLNAEESHGEVRLRIRVTDPDNPYEFKTAVCTADLIQLASEAGRKTWSVDDVLAFLEATGLPERGE